MNRETFVAEVFAFYQTVYAAMPRLMREASTDEERALLQARLVALHDLYWAAEAANLCDFNATVQDIYKDMKSTKERVTERLEGLQEAAQIIGLLTSFISLAASIVTLAKA